MGAPLNPVPNVWRVFLEGFVDNDQVYKWGNVLYFHWTGTTPTHTIAATHAAHIQSSWATNVASLCPSPTTLQSVTITDLTSDTGPEAEFAAATPGTRGDDSIPANAAVLVSWPSPLRFKGGHPRTYLYVLGNADLEGAAHWSGAAVTEVGNHWEAFLEAIVGSSAGGNTIDSYGFVRYRGKYLPNGGPPHYYLDTPLYAAIPTTDWTVRPEMASQRRRIGRRKA
jgi:hypothetical protein